MKKVFKRAAALTAAAALSAGLLAGCGGGGAGSSTTASAAGSANSTSGEITTLTWYMSLNPVAADTQKVIDKLNEYTREKNRCGN